MISGNLDMLASVFQYGMRALSTAQVTCIVVEIKYLNDLEGAVSTTRNFAHTIPYKNTLPLQAV